MRKTHCIRLTHYTFPKITTVKWLCIETIRSDIIILYILYLYSLHEVGKGLACLEPLAVGHLGVIKPRCVHRVQLDRQVERERSADQQEGFGLQNTTVVRRRMTGVSIAI